MNKKEIEFKDSLKNLESKVEAMTSKEMDAVLREALESPLWIAMIKYRQNRYPYLDSILRGTDPMKEPGKIAMIQGMFAGMSDLELYVHDLLRPKEEENKEVSVGTPQPGGTVVG